ncbi:MAG: fumarylacetoacetate hydrolase family protein [Deltaproteobacteria bacterium]|nr:fumarylacetoacetate hydrolase family protein [Deltaproteobacteria bacterium]
MKIVRFLDESNITQTGFYIGDNGAEIVSGNIEKGFIKTGTIKTIKEYLPPLEPVNIFAIGLNYLDHIKETSMERSDFPVLFMKATSSVAAHNSTICLPECEIKGPETDFEGELAVIIGKRVKNATVKNALDSVYGYTCANDVSARRWQKYAGENQWVRGKSFDTFCPLGPYIVTRDEIDDPSNLKIKTELNGKIMQKSNTQNMLFSIGEIISFISRDTTLLPGTVILTGTPDGVGFTRNPRIFLQSDDIIKITIEKIGSLINIVK